MRARYQKKAIRCFGVAESFRKGALPFSVLAGVVMRADAIIDGFVLDKATLGGDDATQSILRMFVSLQRKDINVIIVGGSIISLFNMVDIDHIHEISGVPVISLTYHQSEGLEERLKYHFPSEPSKVESYRKLGERIQIILRTGKSVYLRCAGIDLEDAKRVLNKFTVQGSIAEPIRIARLLARATLNSSCFKST